MSEPKSHQLKHLDFIQAIVARMAQHSFALKGWCISLVLAFIAVLLKEGVANPMYWLPSIPIIFCFWGLDAYYLRREKLFRALYDKVSLDAISQQTTYNMMLDVSFLAAPPWRRTLFNHTVWPLYVVPGLLIVACAMLLRPHLPLAQTVSKSGEPSGLQAASSKAQRGAESAEASRRPFDEVFDEILRTATPRQRYSFLYALPKGGDLHNHLNLSILPEAWLQAALKAEQTHGNFFYAKTRLAGCKDAQDPPILYRTIQRASYLRLSDCQRGEYEPLTTLSPALQAEWLSALTLDKPGEGRDEFFEILSTRLGDLGRDPYLITELLVDNMKRFAAEGVRYLEVQIVGPRFWETDGSLVDDERAAQFLADRLAQPDARSTGVTVRFLAAVVRFLPSAEQDLERAFSLVGRHRDLWVGVNLTGREDKDAGRAQRFLDTFRKLRRTHGEINLALHGGESDAPGSQVRDTLLLGATRVGHAINLLSDPTTTLLMREGKFLIEINLISNRLLGYVPDLANHPFAEYLRLRIPVCLNTDDRGAWGSNLTDEYYTAVTTFNLRWSELRTLSRNSLQYAFLEPAKKSELLRFLDESWLEFEQHYGQGDWRQRLAQFHAVPSGYARRTWGHLDDPN